MQLPELVRAYLNILQMRMGKRLAFEIDVPQDLVDAPFPPLMLPSLVENAIKHGLEPQRDGGVVRISASAEGNRLRRNEIHYDAVESTARLRRSRTLYTPDFLKERAGLGCEAPDPIFIVGLPRSGSTLLEQILASHSQVEGTMELPDITAMARGLTWSANEGEIAKYPDVLAKLPAERWRSLGEEYLASTRIHRRRGTPFFIDKMPNNFAHLGLIHLALPNAKIIDARRHPLGCCFSGFKQHFAEGQNFSYSLTDIGQYYRDYVEFMAHFDSVLPGRVHRVFYESLVEDTESEVRRLLDYCGLPFESSCRTALLNKKSRGE